MTDFEQRLSYRFVCYEFIRNWILFVDIPANPIISAAFLKLLFTENISLVQYNQQ